MIGPAQILRRTDASAAYLGALKTAGLAERVAIDALPCKQKPSVEQLARTEVLMTNVVPPGVG